MELTRIVGYKSNAKETEGYGKSVALGLSHMSRIFNSAKCKRCGCGLVVGEVKKEIPYCKACESDLKDAQYLDIGSEADIRENKDRPKQVRCDYNESETELDKLLEECGL